MEDLQTFRSFKVKSSLKGFYSVSFIDNLQKILFKKVSNKNAIFIIDKKLKTLFNDELSYVNNNGKSIFITCDESHKTIQYSQTIIRKLIKLNVRKNNKIIAIGGGITQDLVAFISSILFRGVDWEFFPTTLLAQCDSCIGSKSSINFDQFKNLIGTFCPPSNIYIYQGFLETLSESEIRSGIGEMLHYYFSEKNNLPNEISKNFNKILIDRSLLTYFINNSLRIKKKIIEIDEFDKEIRHIFNYGHTFGHAIEAITNYNIPHGHAICIGMNIANYISLSLKMINKKQFDDMYSVLKKNIPPFKFSKDNLDIYCKALARDKKNKGNKLGCILTFGPGKLKKIFIEMDSDFKKLLLNYSLEYGT